MKISVIIPCHNAGPWIGEALDSVARQTYQPHEVIVVDDASTDDSLSVAKQTGVASAIVNVQCGNAARSRNIGVERATGDWIAFLDADDLWYPEHLARAHTLLAGSHDVAFLDHNDQLRFSENGASRKVQRNTNPPVQTPTSGLTHDDYFQWYAQSAWFCTNSLVARRDVFLSVGSFDITQRRRHDFEMFLRLIHGNTWAYDPRPGSVYRLFINPTSVSANATETAYYTLRALIKNEFLYSGPIMDRLTTRWAERALRLSIGTGNIELQKRVWRLASTRVSPQKRIAYRLLNKVPGVTQAVKPIVRLFRQRDSTNGRQKVGVA